MQIKKKERKIIKRRLTLPAMKNSSICTDLKSFLFWRQTIIGGAICILEMKNWVH